MTSCTWSFGLGRTVNDFERQARLYSIWLATFSLHFFLIQAWVPQNPGSLPFTLPANQAAALAPLLPFVVEGEFQSDGSVSGDGWGIVTHWSSSGSQVRGFKISIETDKRFHLRVARFDGTSDSSCSSQQAVDDGFRHTFLAVVTASGIQVSVDGLFGLRSTGGCNEGDLSLQPGVNCGFGSFDTSADFTFGGDSCCPSRTFVGALDNINMRRPETHELPRGTAADPTAPAPAPSPGLQGNESTDVLFYVILIPSLLIVLAILVVVGVFIIHTARKKQAMLAGGAAVAATAATASATPHAKAPEVKPTTVGCVAQDAATADPSMCAKAEAAPLRIPASWSQSPSKGSWELAEANSELRNAIQVLMDVTWRDVVTRDRARGGSSLLRHFEVVQVLRNENTSLWYEYSRRQRSVAREMAADDERVATLTSKAVGLDDLEYSCNEAYLFHGSKPSSVKDICKNDFLLKLAGSHRGTLYGHGLYFAESSSKADEYAEDDKDGIYRGLYAMLLCRVTLGRPIVTDEVRPDGARLEAACRGPGATHHSVLGDREKARGTYREFVVFNSTQAYPEFIIVYRRSAP